ncbi:Ribosomal RNA-processing protein 14 [Nakaseomyces bracarensis]|uniref:Ribosomal RNA-processing protein 14 n=1 Tax=Nakaseomyces bracarensis TaxID=273131 RepID=A0ABR4NR48_9SACH
MSNLLEERLRANSSAFEGLLSLIPSKYYYDEKTQDQWKLKKKDKDTAREDKVKKLDPEQRDDESNSALEVMKKREKDAVPVKLPGAVKRPQESEELDEEEAEGEGEGEGDSIGTEEEEDIKVIFDDEGNEVDLSAKKKAINHEVKNDYEIVPESSEEKAAVVEEPKSEPKLEEKNKKLKNVEELWLKLQAKIKALKEKRKAPGTNVQGAARSREAILEQRKKREELRKKRKLEETHGSDSENDDAESSSDSENEEIDETPKKKQKKNVVDAKDIMFQNIIFDDGDRTTSDLQRLRKTPNAKKKGPAKNDIKAHLKLLEAKKNKVTGKDELEQIKLKEKEKWQKAMLQAEGVRVRDDEKLLKKALKKKEAKKRKSAVEWDERKRAVKTNIAEKQKRREENLAIRKQNKGVKRGKQQKMKRKFTGSVMPKKRAGFEGRLKSGKKK